MGASARSPSLNLDDHTGAQTLELPAAHTTRTLPSSLKRTTLYVSGGVDELTCSGNSAWSNGGLAATGVSPVHL